MILTVKKLRELIKDYHDDAPVTAAELGSDWAPYLVINVSPEFDPDLARKGRYGPRL